MKERWGEVTQKQSKTEKNPKLYLYLKMAADSKYPENKKLFKITDCGSATLYFPFIVFSCLENLLQADFTAVLTQCTLFRKALGALQR